jgi:predicted membrane chloride channel (bestrophin family)
MGYSSTLLKVVLFAIFITVVFAFIIFLVPNSAQLPVGIVGTLLGIFISFKVATTYIIEPYQRQHYGIFLTAPSTLIPFFGTYTLYLLFNSF